jgi:hypothetical protein
MFLERLHSGYNPQAEADRYIDALNLTACEYFILIEPGLGYIIPALKKRFPKSKIIALHAGEGFETEEKYGIPAWQKGSLEIQQFLEREISDVEASAIKIIEWRPALSVFGKAYAEVLSNVVEFVKRADAGARTTGAFGTRWVKNFFKNLSLIRQAVVYTPSDLNVIIAGAGPGLERLAPQIKALQENVLVIAASSSVMALGRAGVHADIVIATDGGCWALKHIYPFLRGPKSTLAISLFAALPSQSNSVPFLLLNDGSLWQSIVLKELSIPSVLVAQSGTVAASAVELAMTLSDGSLYLAGVDLCQKDIMTHVRHYGFDYLFYGSSSRINPVYSQLFYRSRLMREGGSYDIYAKWFKNRLGIWPGRVFTLEKDHAVFPYGVPQIKNGAGKNSGAVFRTVPLEKGLCLSGLKVLAKEMEGSRTRQLNDELAPLLFPGEKNIPAGKLINKIYELASRYGRNGE